MKAQIKKSNFFIWRGVRQVRLKLFQTKIKNIAGSPPMVGTVETVRWVYKHCVCENNMSEASHFQVVADNPPDKKVRFFQKECYL